MPKKAVGKPSNPPGAPRVVRTSSDCSQKSTGKPVTSHWLRKNGRLHHSFFAGGWEMLTVFEGHSGSFCLNNYIGDTHSSGGFDAFAGQGSSAEWDKLVNIRSGRQKKEPGVWFARWLPPWQEPSVIIGPTSPGGWRNLRKGFQPTGMQTSYLIQLFKCKVGDRSRKRMDTKSIVSCFIPRPEEDSEMALGPGHLHYYTQERRRGWFFRSQLLLCSWTAWIWVLKSHEKALKRGDFFEEMLGPASSRIQQPLSETLSPYQKTHFFCAQCRLTNWHTYACGVLVPRRSAKAGSISAFGSLRKPDGSFPKSSSSILHAPGHAPNDEHQDFLKTWQA